MPLHARVLCWVAVGLVGLVSGCAGGAASPPPTAASVAPLTAAALDGVWVEYWAPGGAADTERYRFEAASRFVWDARRAAAGRGPVHKQGAFRLEQSGGELVMSVEAEDFAACESCGAEAGAPRHVEHRQPILERYELGECAPNVEAQARDAHYACVALGGHAFWRQRQ